MNKDLIPPKYLYGIIGCPLSHTASPALHTWLFSRLGVAASYYAWPVEEKDLPVFMQALRLLPVHGLSVTIPYKQKIMQFVDNLDPVAVRAGAVNTLYWRDDKLQGTNTDAYGFIYPLRLRAHNPQNILILGAGGASRAVLTGLLSLSEKTNILLTTRNKDKAKKLAQEFDVDFLPWEERADAAADLIVNTTPLGMQGSSSEGESALLAEDFERIAEKGQSGTGLLAYDIVYRPLKTPFLSYAETAGWQIQDGLDMLIAQGLKQFEIWTGCKNLPPLNIIRQELESNFFM